jgi:glycosyltransferase involved in cell wall biosynthesis
MRILMLCDWLPPDFGAVGQYAVGFAEELAEQGHVVCLVGFSSKASAQSVDSYGKGSLTERRIHMRSYDRAALGQRAFWTLRANLQLLWSARRELVTADEIRFTGSPPYLLHFIAPLKSAFRGTLRYRITDFHPECLIAAMESTPIWLRIIQRLTWFWRRRIDVMEVIGEDQRQRLLAGGIERRRIELRRDPSPVVFPVDLRAAPLPAPLQGRKVVLYSGNWGVAHDHETFAVGMALFEQKHPGVCGVWLNATGARADQAEAAMRAVGVTVHRTPPCPLKELPALLMAADAHLITLADAFVGYVLPSKVYACIESGRPVLFVGSAFSDVHALCTLGVDVDRYRRVDVGDAEGVCRGLEDILRVG